MTHGATRDAANTTPDRTDELVSRLEAVERTLTGTDADVSALEDAAAIEARISDLESTVETIADRLDEVDAATQAMRGYVGGVRTVNEDVERRANAALAKAESLEEALVDESATKLGSEQVASTDSSPPTYSDAATGSHTDHRQHDAATGSHTDHRQRDASTPERDRFGSAHNVGVGADQRPRDDQTTDDSRRGLAARLRDAL